MLAKRIILAILVTICALPLMAVQKGLVIDTRGVYGVLRVETEHNWKDGQIIYVNRESPAQVWKARIILANEFTLAVKLLSGSEEALLQKGDILYLDVLEQDVQEQMAQIATAVAAPVAQPSRRIPVVAIASAGEKTTIAATVPVAEPSANTGSDASMADLGLHAGLWVEAKGKPDIHGDQVLIEKIDVVESDNTDPQKMEIYARVTTAIQPGDTGIILLNQSIDLSDKTGFEDESGRKIERADVQAGQWVKLKIRIKEDGKLFARSIRRIASRDRYKVAGYLSSSPAAGSNTANSVMVGGVSLQLNSATRVDKAGESPLNTFFEDEQKSVLFSIRAADNLMFGGQIISSNRADDERDLRRADRRDKQIFSGEFKLDMLWQLNRSGTFVFAEGLWGLREELRNQVHENTFRTLRLAQAYFYWPVTNYLAVQVGRQDFDEEREWVYDERLDAIRLHAHAGPLRLEVSASSQPKIWEDDEEAPEVANYIANLQYTINPDFFLAAYLVQRDAVSKNEFSPAVYGLRAYSWPRNGLRYWVDLARAEGQDGKMRIDGYAFDTGLSWVPGESGFLTLTGGVAYATGRDNVDDQSGAFRQTGINDNNGRFGGISSFRYYGEVVDPELSNRFIATSGIGLRPVNSFSIDVVGHYFRQAKLSEDLGDTRLRADPNAESKELGWELDVIMGLRIQNRASMELVLGRFNPGKAFNFRNAAHVAEMQMRFKF